MTTKYINDISISFPMKKFMVLGVLFLLSMGFALGACVTPSEDEAIGAGTTSFCGGIYTLNDSNVNGAIIINADNVDLDCNNSKFIGNYTTNSIGIYNNNHDNVSIKNCHFRNYTYALYVRSSDNVTLLNNHINESKYGVRIRDSGTVTAQNNTLQATTTQDYGFRLMNIGGNNTIQNNDINGFKYGVTTENTNKENDILDNVIYNTLYDGVKIGTYANVVNNNTIYNTSSNGIEYENCNNTIISNNTIYNYKHHGIDNHDDTYNVKSQHSKIYGNTITQVNSDYSIIGTSGIFIQASANVEIYNNRLSSITNATTNSTTCRGIVVEGGSGAYNNSVYSNVLNTITGVCLKSGANNTRWRNNSLTGCTSSVLIYGYRTDRDYSSFTNNRGNTPNYYLDNALVNVSINETSSIGHYITFANGGELNFMYSGRKAFDLDGSTGSVYDLAAPNNDIFDWTADTMIEEDTTDWTGTISASQEIRVGDYSQVAYGKATAIFILAIIAGYVFVLIRKYGIDLEIANVIIFMILLGGIIYILLSLI